MPVSRRWRASTCEVRAGEVFAFLGPNGAGKTTTVEILEGYRRRNAGEVCVLGDDPAKAGRDWRARIGVVLQESEPEAELTAEECLSLYAGYYPAPRPVAETLELVGLADRRNARCGRMSGGQRRRLDVALALIGDPELIFLDEPTTGFDPAARQSAWDVIAGLRDLGKTIFLTTHYMEEAERLADRIAVLAAGRIVAEGTAATLGGRDAEASVISFTLPPGVTAADLPPAVAACVTSTGNGQVEARTASPLPLLGTLAAWAQGPRHRPPRPSGPPPHARGRLPATHQGAPMTAVSDHPGPATGPGGGWPASSRTNPALICAASGATPKACSSPLILPVLFLVILASIFRNATVKVPGGTMKESVYYVPAIITFGLIAAAFSNLTVTVVRNRESGIYKRRRATPLPASAVIAGRALVAVLTALAITAVLLVIGWAAYGANIPSSTAPAFVLDIIVGAVVVLLPRLRRRQPHRQRRRRPARGPGHRPAAQLHLRRLHRHLRTAQLAR